MLQPIAVAIAARTISNTCGNLKGSMLMDKLFLKE